jgi:hypothetical protein
MPIFGGSLLLWFVLAGPGGPAAAGNASGSALQPHQGRYFRWLAPQGWQARETNAGVTLTSADGQYSVSLAMILRSRGTITPLAFLQWVFNTNSHSNGGIAVSFVRTQAKACDYQELLFERNSV